MRHFKLMNDAGRFYDITTKGVLFYDIGGLGFEEDNVFNRIGSVWWLAHTEYKQATITGKIIFTEEDGNEPYLKYQEFVQFIAQPPLTLMYNPFGPVKSTLCNDTEADENAYYRTVRVSKLDKTEKNEYGVLDCAIDFIAYTPWYRRVHQTMQYDEPEDGSADTGWIWGDDAENPPLMFQPEGETKDGVIVVPAYTGSATRARFRWEPPNFLSYQLTALGNSPAILTIHGPITNPRWTHTLVTNTRTLVLCTGSFNTEDRDIELLKGEKIIIDGTPTKYSITKVHLNGTTSDLYPYRNFEESCFITLKNGENRIAVVSSSGELSSHIELEGYIYDATV